MRKQSSGASEQDRSIEEQVVDNADSSKKPEDLLLQLRSEMMRNESLSRSLQHINRLEANHSATRPSAHAAANLSKFRHSIQLLNLFHFIIIPF